MASLGQAAAMLRAAAEARKCWACGCLRHALSNIESATLGDDGLSEEVALLRERLVPQRYDCLGCTVCFPAVALNELGSAGLVYDGACPTEPGAERKGWPPLPGDYTVLRYNAPVAVCTLNDDALCKAVVATRVDALAVVGTLHTENLGIERMIFNVVANPHIRFVVVCGSDSRQLIGHLPGQSLMALAQNGLDAHQRIIGAKGKRPLLRNLDQAVVDHFRATREVVDLSGISDIETIVAAVQDCAARDPGAAELVADTNPVVPIQGTVPTRMISDPAGYFVIYPDRARSLLSVEHYANTGVLTTVIEGTSAAELYTTAIERNLVSRLDHAAYLGRELARAETALASGAPYVQDAAPEAPGKHDCGCTDASRVTAAEVARGRRIKVERLPRVSRRSAR